MPSKYPPVTSKQQSYNLLQTGGFGNRLRMWRSLCKFEASGFTGQVVLRYLGESGGGWCKYNTHPSEVEGIMQDWARQGANADLITINEQAPDHAIILQGEHLNAIEWPDCIEAFEFSRVKEQMRTALAAERIRLRGPWCRFILRDCMTPSSWEDYNVLLVNYPGHVLEVSVYSKCLGNLQMRNALIWEVRQY